jgi:hypothetical protein
VLDGVEVNVGDEVIVEVEVNVTTAQRGAESDKPDGLIVFTVSS